MSGWRDNPEIVRDAPGGEAELTDERWDRAFQLVMLSGVAKGIGAIPGSGMFMRAILNLGRRSIAQDPEGAREGMIQFLGQVCAVLEIEPREVFPGLDQ